MSNQHGHYDNVDNVDGPEDGGYRRERRNSPPRPDYGNAQHYDQDRSRGPPPRSAGGMPVMGAGQDEFDFPSAAPTYNRAPARRAQPSNEPSYQQGAPHRYSHGGNQSQGQGYEPRGYGDQRRPSYSRGPPAPSGLYNDQQQGNWPPPGQDYGRRGDPRRDSWDGRSSREGSRDCPPVGRMSREGSRDAPPVGYGPPNDYNAYGGNDQWDRAPPRRGPSRDDPYGHHGGEYEFNHDARQGYPAGPPDFNRRPSGSVDRSMERSSFGYEYGQGEQGARRGSRNDCDETFVARDAPAYDEHQLHMPASEEPADTGSYGGPARRAPPSYRPHDEGRFAESKQSFDYDEGFPGATGRGRPLADARGADSDSNVPSSNSSHMSNISDEADERGSHGSASECAKAEGPGGDIGDEFETVAPGGVDAPMVECLIVRDRSGMKRMNPEYYLYVQNGRKRGSEKLLLVARKQIHQKSVSYHIFNVARGHLGGRLNKKGGNYVGKLKCSTNKAENVMFNNEELKEEVGGVLFSKPSVFDHMREGAQPRNLRVILPPVDENQLPTAVRPKYHDPFSGILSQIQAEDVQDGYTVLERKEPVYENGHYRLNFHGRVTVPSVKNFQLVSPEAEDPNDIICQFGKVKEDRFHLDFKGPMNYFQAFCAALAQFNY